MSTNTIPAIRDTKTAIADRRKAMRPTYHNKREDLTKIPFKIPGLSGLNRFAA